MAKNKHQDEPQVAEAEAPTSESSAASIPTGDIIVKGISFVYSTPYAAGHSLTEGEAHQLNQVRGENLRNNFASKVKAKLDEAEKEGRSLTDEETAALQAEFATYDSQYAFTGKRIARGPQDPVKAKARKMARETIEAALRGKNIKPSDLADGKMDELIDQYLDRNPQVMEQAKAQVEAVKAAASEALGGVDLESLTQAPAEAAA